MLHVPDGTARGLMLSCLGHATDLLEAGLLEVKTTLPTSLHSGQHLSMSPATPLQRYFTHICCLVTSNKCIYMYVRVAMKQKGRDRVHSLGVRRAPLALATCRKMRPRLRMLLPTWPLPKVDAAATFATCTYMLRAPLLCKAHKGSTVALE